MSTPDLVGPTREAAGAPLRRTFAHLGAANAPRRWGLLTLFAAGGLAVVLAAMVFVDAWAVAQQRNFAPWVVQVFERITDFGKSGWFLWPIAVLVIAAAALARPELGRLANGVILAIVVRLEFVFFAIGIPALAVSIVKRLIGRARPSDWGPFHYVPFSWKPGYASLPSGHSTAAFAAAFAIGAVWPRARLAMWIYAAVIAVSRVVVHAHFPSDVIAGGFVGVVGAILVRNWFAARRLAFVPGPDGRVSPLPGPSARRLRNLTARIAAH